VPPRPSPRKKRGLMDQWTADVQSRSTIYLLNPGSRQWERTNLLDSVPPVLIPGASVDIPVINNRGQILVHLFYETEKSYVFRALVWDRGRIQELGAKDLWVAAESMNDAGQVVGKLSRTNQCGWTPFIWQGGAFYDLNKLIVGKPGIKIEKVKSINNKGWILCDAEDAHWSYTVILRPDNSSPGSIASARLETRPSP
jgi:hypothetical protein